MHQIAPPPSLSASAPQVLPLRSSLPETELIYLEVRVPRAMRDAVVRHHANLVELSETLRGAGLPEAVVIAHVDVAIASYREALVASIASRKL